MSRDVKDKRAASEKTTQTSATPSAQLVELPSGGHRWTIRIKGDVVFASTSNTVVEAIRHISRDYAPALKRLAEE